MTPQLWINKQVKRGRAGHFEIEGDCGPQRVLVEIDRSIAEHLPPGDPEQGLAAIHREIQIAARLKWHNDGAFPVYHSHSDEFSHMNIALTTEDLAHAFA